jgi:CRP-like cAMP-binding protein
MFDLLSNPAFAAVPPGNLHTLFGRFESMPVVTGQVIVRQGEAGDYYYLIRSGRARVSRDTADHRTIQLAELLPGQGFGEEALISGEPRNATVTMVSDGELMRLPAADFDSLLREPLVHHVNPAQGAELLRQGAQLIDVRLEAEFAEGSLKGSSNLPLYLLRLKANHLDRNQTYLLFCQSGRRSGTAAFLLAQRGFDARVLQGGLAALQKPGTAYPTAPACHA